MAFDGKFNSFIFQELTFYLERRACIQALFLILSFTNRSRSAKELCEITILFLLPINQLEDALHIHILVLLFTRTYAKLSCID